MDYHGMKGEFLLASPIKFNTPDHYGMDAAMGPFVPPPIGDSKLYFECHITIEPVFDLELDAAALLAKQFHFRVADLLMQKRHEDMPSRSKYDTFMTGRHKNYEVLYEKMFNLIKALQERGFKIWRYKIEDTIIDSKIKDVEGLLDD